MSHFTHHEPFSAIIDFLRLLQWLKLTNKRITHYYNGYTHVYTIEILE